MAYFPYSHWWRYRWFHWYQVCLLKFYLNSLVCDRNIFRSSSKSSAICRNFRKMFGNVRLAFATSESGRKSLENRQKRRHQYVRIIKRTLHVSLNLCEWAQRMSEILFLPREHKIHGFSPPCNILYVWIREEHFFFLSFSCLFLLDWCAIMWRLAVRL